MSKIIKSGQCVETRPLQLPPVDVDSFFIENEITWPENVATEAAIDNSETEGFSKQVEEQTGSDENAVPAGENETAAVGAGPNLEEAPAGQDNFQTTDTDVNDADDSGDEDIVVTINQADRKRLESVLLDFENKPEPKFDASREKPLVQKAAAGLAPSEAESEAINLDHLADVAASIESLFSGVKEQAGTVAKDAVLHEAEREAGTIINGASQRAARAMEEAEQHAAKITFSAEHKASSIRDAANEQADIVIAKAKDQAALIIEGTRQKVEKSLEKTKQQAETILAEANNEAARIIEEANKQTAVILEEASQQGISIREQAYQEGLAAGRQDAIHVVRQELSDNFANALALVNEIESERMQRISSSEPELIKLAVSIAEKIIGEEIELDALRQLQIVREALSRVTTANMIRIRIHSDDLQLVRENLTLLQSSFSEPKPIEVKEDSSISRGSCFVETDRGNLDARVKSQLERILTELLKVGNLA